MITSNKTVAKAIDPDLPLPGFYRMRRARDGAFVPVVIFIPCPIDIVTGEPLDRPRYPCAVIDGEDAAAFDAWPWCAREQITQARYELMLARKESAIRYDQGHPIANPKKPVDLDRTKPIF